MSAFGGAGQGSILKGESAAMNAFSRKSSVQQTSGGGQLGSLPLLKSTAKKGNAFNERSSSTINAG